MRLQQVERVENNADINAVEITAVDSDGKPAQIIVSRRTLLDILNRYLLDHEFITVELKETANG